jgi:hypothetical protein
MLFRLVRKTVILGLAAFGAYSIYEMVRPKAEQLASSAGNQLPGAIDDAADTASKVRDDVAEAKDDVVSDLKAGLEQQQDRLSAATAPLTSEPVDTEAPQVGLV